MNDPLREPPFTRTILFLLTGPILWAGHLIAVYAFQSVACATGSWMAQTAVIPTFIGLATLVAAAFLLLVFWSPERLAQVLYRQSGRGVNQPFLVRAARLLSLLSMAGVLWAGSAALVLEECGLLR